MNIPERSGQPTILIVDDDEGLSRLLERVVRREGFHAATALSGRQALLWLEDNHADLMLLDLHLQDMGGRQVVEELSTRHKSVPFIIITGQGDERVAVEVMKQGALDYLVKDGQFLEYVPALIQRAISQLDKDRRLVLAEEALRQEHAFSAAVLRTSGAIMIVLDASGRVVQINEACEKVSGYSAGDVIGKSMWESLLPLDVWESSKLRFSPQAASPENREYEGVLLTKQGDLRMVAWNITALKNQDGTAEYVIASGLDVTERRQLEKMILEISGKEQQRIGQDLHDGLCQVLAGIDVLTQVLLRKMLADSKNGVGELSTISDYVKEAIRQARMLSRGLSPVEIDSRGLMSALQQLASTTCELFQVNCVFDCAQPVFVEDNGMATHLYRICQEAISNAIKHGQAANVVISLVQSGDTTRLEIRDDGSGFVENVPHHSGMGLRSMRYRAGTIGAELSIKAAKPHGTSVSCSFATSL